jgi:hypothetical protein
MAKKSDANGIRSALNEEIIIDIRADGVTSCTWLTLESQEILSSVGKEPEEFARISPYCG